MSYDRSRRRIAAQPLTWHTRVEKTGRWSYTITATTIPEGGTAVVTWRRRAAAAAFRLRNRIHRLQNLQRARRAAYAAELHEIEAGR